MKVTFRFTLFFIAQIFAFSGCKNQQSCSSDHSYTPVARHGINDKNGVPEGLSVGDVAPDFAINDSVSLYEVLQEDPVMLFFYRGYWCPVCNRYLSNIEDSLEMVRERGVSIFGVSPELVKFTEETKKQSGTSIDLISDSSYSIQDQYKVRFTTTERYQLKIQVGLMKSISETNGSNADLPVPATFLIGRDHKVFYTHFDLDYHHRATIKDIIEALDQQKVDR